MNKKNIMIAFGIFIVFGIGLFYFKLFHKEKPEALKITALPMSVATAYWPGQYWLDIAHTKGWFKEAGLNFKLINANDDYTQSVKDLAQGKIDGNEITLYSLMYHRARGADLVMVLHSDVSYGADAIVAKAPIDTIQGLRGKRIAVKKGSYLEFMLGVVLDKANIAFQDVELVDIEAEKAPEALVSNQVDAIVAYEPFASQPLKKMKGFKIFDSSKIEGLIPDGYVFHRKFIEQRPHDVQAFVNVWHKTTEFIKTNPKEAFGIIARIYNKTPGEVQAFTQVDKLMDLDDNITAYSYGSGFSSLHGTARKIHKYLIQRGLASDKPLDSSTFLNHHFIFNLDRSLKKEYK